MLDLEVDALLDVAVLDLLVEDDTDCGFRNVIDNSSLAIVAFVGLDS